MKKLLIILGLIFSVSVFSQSTVVKERIFIGLNTPNPCAQYVFKYDEETLIASELVFNDDVPFKYTLGKITKIDNKLYFVRLDDDLNFSNMSLLVFKSFEKLIITTKDMHGNNISEIYYHEITRHETK